MSSNPVNTRGGHGGTKTGVTVKGVHSTACRCRAAL